MKFIINIDKERYNAITNPKFATKDVSYLMIALGFRAAKELEYDTIDLTPVLEGNDEDSLKISERLLLDVVGALSLMRTRNSQSNEE